MEGASGHQMFLRYNILMYGRRSDNMAFCPWIWNLFRTRNHYTYKVEFGAPQQHYRKTEHFDETPQFLDSLLFLADSLFQVPPKERKNELQNALRALECDLLPSNPVYLPVSDVHHRVWRIVADESVAISTKEHVQCIVCLEVVRKHIRAAYLTGCPASLVILTASILRTG